MSSSSLASFHDICVCMYVGSEFWDGRKTLQVIKDENLFEECNEVTAGDTGIMCCRCNYMWTVCMYMHIYCIYFSYFRMISFHWY